AIKITDARIDSGATRHQRVTLTYDSASSVVCSSVVCCLGTMLAWQLVDRAPIPGSSGELHLYKRGAEFSIRHGSGQLMNSRTHGSEDALAELTCARIADCR